MRKKSLNTRTGEQKTAVCILVTSPAFEDRAKGLSDLLGLPVCRDPGEIGTAFGLALLPEEDGLSLFDGKMTLRGDFTHMLHRLTPGKLSSELLVRAAKLRDPGPCPVAIDCTAGLGEDSMLLAAMGYTVHLFEYDSITAELLDNALCRSRSSDSSGALSAFTNRMILHKEDSLAVLSALKGLPVRSKEEITDIGTFPYLTSAPDLIYLDPMFPARRKSGLITKKLQRLESPCADESALLTAAICANPRRIVIKRPLKGPFLADIKPAYSIRGKAIRYDCMTVRG